MAGELARMTMRVSARAAVRNLRALRVLGDAYGDVYGGNQPPSLDQLEMRLANNDIEAVAQALPSLMAQVLQAEQQQQGQ